MPRRPLLSWDKTKNRWLKEYKPPGADKGRKYAVSPRQLKDLGLLSPNASETNKEASYQAAHAWWRRKRAEIDQANGTADSQPLPRPPQESRREQVVRLLAHALSLLLVRDGERPGQ